MMPLSLAQVGEENIIKRIGGSPEVKRHLENLGFVVGGEVTVVNTLGGNVIVNVKEARVAISKEMAVKIMVERQRCLFTLHKHKRNVTRRRNQTMKNLKEAKIGETVRVVKIHGEGAIKRRIMDMGLTKGVEVYIRKVAPLGDPIEVTVRGYELSLRKADAEQIEVE